MIDLLSKTPEEVTAWVKEQGESAFRGAQLYEWLMKGVPFSDMRNLPVRFRAMLEASAIANPVRIRDSIASKLDGTVKFLYELPDGNLIEGVRMQYTYGYTLCLSTQVGCRMGCAFCASTLDGRARDVTAGEMLGQIIAVNRTLPEGEQIGNVVLMGSGEPFDNYENTIHFLRLLSHEKGMRHSLRSVSLSTCGLVPAIDRFIGEKLPVTLSLSLHAPNDEIRRTIMPVARLYTIDDTIAACRRYVRQTGRRLIVEYALIKGVNDNQEHAIELASRLRGFQCHVNLIPLNAVAERGLCPPGYQAVTLFRETLDQHHISATVRREMGNDIEGACGQLRRRALQNEMETNA